MQELKRPVLTGDLMRDVTAYLGETFKDTARHSIEVAACARELAAKFKEDPAAAEAAGLLHDISVVIPNKEKLMRAEEWGIDICKEEELLPMISHQKLSRYMAAEFFGVKDENVLSAIECHTTLKNHANKMEQVVFVADKIKWDQAGEPPYLDSLQESLEESLEAASLTYINYLMVHDIIVVHPWLKAAQEWLEYSR
ncbi:bis(5'-nucleosyl)-tetraphosphatase (symmetrical) YqeK [Enterococcus sp. LJL128]